MSIADKIRVVLAPSYLLLGVVIVARGVREPLGWILGLSFAAYGVYRIALVKRALRK